MRKLFCKRIEKETTRKQRIVVILIVSLIVVACIIVSYVCFSKQNENQRFAWLSSLLLNIGAGTAITAIFIYVSEVRLRRYRLQESLDNLRYLIHRTYYTLQQIENGSPEQKLNCFKDFISVSKYKKIEYDLIESNRPKLRKDITDLRMISHDYISEILKQSNYYDISEKGEIINYEFINGININKNVKELSKFLIKSCDNLLKALD